MLLSTQITDNENYLVCCYIHNETEIVNIYLIYWTSNNVQYTWDIWRPRSPKSSVKWILGLCYTRNTGVTTSVQSVEWKWITTGIIISIPPIISNGQVSDYIPLGFIYKHLSELLLGWFYYSYASHVLMMIIWFLWFSIFYEIIMFLMILIYESLILYLYGIKLLLIYKEDKAAVGYVCLCV